MDQQGEGLEPNDEPRGQFGQSVALSSDGNTALIGGRFRQQLCGCGVVFVQNTPQSVSPAILGNTQVGQMLSSPMARGPAIRHLIYLRVAARWLCISRSFNGATYE